MNYCSHCGKEIPEDAYFCPNCGTRALKGAEANVGAPSGEMRDAFAKMSQELEKAFAIAAKEMQAAFQTATENIQKSFYKEPIVCPSCGEKNSGSAIFCSNCGKKLDTK